MTADLGHDPAADWQDFANELATPVSPRLVPVASSSEEDWLTARRGGITASEIAVVLGLSPYSSPYALYWQKTGDLSGDFESDRLALGQYLEPYVVDRFTQRHPELAATGDGRTLWMHGSRPWQMATPDRVVFPADPNGNSRLGCDPLAVLEAKTSATFDGWGDDGSDEIPVHYRCQLLWQMDVMAVTAGYLACVFLPGAQLRIYEIGHGPGSCKPDDGSRDPCAACADLDIMRHEARNFRRLLKTGTPPEPDWRPATAAALKARHPEIADRDVTIGQRLAISYRAACRHYKAAEQRKDEMTNRVLAEIGDGHRAVTPNGDVIASRQVYPVKESVRKAYTVRKLVPVAPKTPKESAS